MTSARAVPFFCPYCGDEDLTPYGEEPGTWRCGSCTRVFTLHFDGLSPKGEFPDKP